MIASANGIVASANGIVASANGIFIGRKIAPVPIPPKRFVLIKQSLPGVLAIGEVEVISNGVNVALHKSVQNSGANTYIATLGIGMIASANGIVASANGMCLRQTRGFRSIKDISVGTRILHRLHILLVVK
jgi:hypothetical protein